MLFFHRVEYIGDRLYVGCMDVLSRPTLLGSVLAIRTRRNAHGAMRREAAKQPPVTLYLPSYVTRDFQTDACFDVVWWP